MTLTEKIKDKIEQLKGEVDYHENVLSVLNKLKLYIDIISDEQASKDLEEETKLYQLDNPVINHNNSVNRPLGWTTLEEAKQLVKAGLNPNTADMYWAPDADTVVPTSYITKIDNETLIPAYKGAVPCWSIGALLELIPKIHESEDDGGCYPALCKRYDTDKWHCLYYRDTLYKTRQCDTAIEAIIEMVIWLLKYELI